MKDLIFSVLFSTAITLLFFGVIVLFGFNTNNNNVNYCGGFITAMSSRFYYDIIVKQNTKK